MAIRLALTLGAFLIAVVVPASGGAPTTPPPVSSSVVVIVLENREFDEVIGNPAAPFINRLARRGALAERYFAVAHPSLPNYLALLGGSTFGVVSDCTECTARGANLAQQLSRAGVSWRAYMERLPRPCFDGEASGEYVKRHNPFMYFPSISDEPGRCANIVPESRLAVDIRRYSLPAFAWIEPGLCHGGHDCGVDVVDRYLSGLVQRLRRRLGPAGFLVVTFDEGTSDRGCCGAPAGGRVATILSGPSVRSGARLRRPYDHFSTLATIEDVFDLPRLRHARGASSLRAAFEPARHSHGR